MDLGYKNLAVNYAYKEDNHLKKTQICKANWTGTLTNILLIRSKTTCIILTNASAVHVNLTSSPWRTLIDYLEYSRFPLTFWSSAMWPLHHLFMVEHDIAIFQTCHSPSGANGTHRKHQNSLHSPATWSLEQRGQGTTAEKATALAGRYDYRL